MGDIDVRPARPTEWAAVGGLRWDSVFEFGGEALDPREVFAEQFAEWASEHQDTHECFVAVADGAVIGMTWLAVIPRVPSARAFDRAHPATCSARTSPPNIATAGSAAG